MGLLSVFHDVGRLERLLPHPPHPLGMQGNRFPQRRHRFRKRRDLCMQGLQTGIRAAQHRPDIREFFRQAVASVIGAYRVYPV